MIKVNITRTLGNLKYGQRGIIVDDGSSLSIIILNGESPFKIISNNSSHKFTWKDGTIIEVDEPQWQTAIGDWDWELDSSDEFEEEEDVPTYEL